MLLIFMYARSVTYHSGRSTGIKRNTSGKQVGMRREGNGKDVNSLQLHFVGGAGRETHERLSE